MYSLSSLAALLLLTTPLVQAAYVKVSIGKSCNSPPSAKAELLLNGFLNPGVTSHKFELDPNTRRPISGAFTPLMYWSMTSGPIRPSCRVEGTLDKHVEFVEFTISEKKNYLTPCGFQHGIRIVCEGPRSECTVWAAPGKRRMEGGAEEDEQ